MLCTNLFSIDVLELKSVKIHHLIPKFVCLQACYGRQIGFLPVPALAAIFDILKQAKLNFH